MIATLLIDFFVPIALGVFLRAFGGVPLWVAATVTCVCWSLLIITFLAGEEFAECKIILRYERGKDKIPRPQPAALTDSSVAPESEPPPEGTTVDWLVRSPSHWIN